MLPEREVTCQKVMVSPRCVKKAGARRERLHPRCGHRLGFLRCSSPDSHEFKRIPRFGALRAAAFAPQRCPSCRWTLLAGLLLRTPDRERRTACGVDCFPTRQATMN